MRRRIGRLSGLISVLVIAVGILVARRAESAIVTCEYLGSSFYCSMCSQKSNKIFYEGTEVQHWECEDSETGRVWHQDEWWGKTCGWCQPTGPGGGGGGGDKPEPR